MLILLGLYEILKQNLNDLESIIFPFFFFKNRGKGLFFPFQLSEAYFIFKNFIGT